MSGTSSVDVVYESFTPSGGVVEGQNPIILLHAMCCSKEIWTTIPQAVADSTGRMVYAYDARHHGSSPHTGESNVSSNVADLFSLMDKIKGKDEKFILVGHDMGGMTAMSAALKKPEIFEKVIVVEMYAKKVHEDILSRSKGFVTGWSECVKELPKDTPLEDVTRKSVENLFKRLKFQETNEKESYQKGNFLYKKTDVSYESHYNGPALVLALEQLESADSIYEGKYEGPSYFFYGTASHFKVQDETVCIKKHFPKSELVPFENGSHMFVADIPDKLAEEISRHVKQSSQKVM